MDSVTDMSAPALSPLFRLPGWAFSRRSPSEADAAFAAGIALNSLDNLVRTEPLWAGCWRDRQALKCAVAAVRSLGRTETENALRDAVLLAAPGDDPGPAGRAFLALKRLAGRKSAVTASFLAEIAELLALPCDGFLAGTIVDLMEDASQSGRAVPFVVADLVSAIHAARPDAETLAWGLADRLLAERLGWDVCLPLLMAERYGAAFRTVGGRGRVHPGEDGFGRAVCLAVVEAASAALRRAAEISRRAEKLATLAPKIRTRGAQAVLRKLLDEDAVPTSAPGANLSRWASARLFERLDDFGAVRELSGRASFRIFGL